jgi:pimeloyl-ACP methyl ester carboxylesterase
MDLAAGPGTRTIDVLGIQTLVRERPGEGVPVIFWHGNPTDSRDWLPFLDRISAPAFAADMPGFGGSGRPDPRDFDYSMDSYAEWAAALLEALGVDGRYSLLVHDWGGTGLLAALRDPARVERMVAFNTVPFGAGYRWHWIARLWRQRVLGEIFNAGARVPILADLVLRQARPGFRRMPRSFIERFSPNWRDPGMRRAMLALYRSADEDLLQRAGAGLPRFEAPTLLLWAQRDPYIAPIYGRRMADRLPNAELVEIEDAGHWPWFDRPDLIDRAVCFLEGG